MSSTLAVTTGLNANVLYEVGYAHAREKLVLLLTKNENDIPFNLRDRQHVIYDKGANMLSEKLVPSLKDAIRHSSLGYLYSHLDPDHEIELNTWFKGKGSRISSSSPDRSFSFEARIKLIRRIERRHLGYLFEIESYKGILRSEYIELLGVSIVDEKMTIRWAYKAFDPEIAPRDYLGITELEIRNGHPVNLRYFNERSSAGWITNFERCIK